MPAFVKKLLFFQSFVLVHFALLGDAQGAFTKEQLKKASQKCAQYLNNPWIEKIKKRKKQIRVSLKLSQPSTRSIGRATDPLELNSNAHIKATLSILKKRPFFESLFNNVDKLMEEEMPSNKIRELKLQTVRQDLIPLLLRFEHLVYWRNIDLGKNEYLGQDTQLQMLVRDIKKLPKTLNKSPKEWVLIYRFIEEVHKDMDEIMISNLIQEPLFKNEWIEHAIPNRLQGSAVEFMNYRFFSKLFKSADSALYKVQEKLARRDPQHQDTVAEDAMIFLALLSRQAFAKQWSLSKPPRQSQAEKAVHIAKKLPLLFKYRGLLKKDKFLSTKLNLGLNTLRIVPLTESFSTEFQETLHLEGALKALVFVQEGMLEKK